MLTARPLGAGGEGCLTSRGRRQPRSGMKRGHAMEPDRHGGVLTKSRSDNRQTQTRETRERREPLPTPSPAVAFEELSPRSEELLRLSSKTYDGIPASRHRACLLRSPFVFRFIVCFARVQIRPLLPVKLQGKLMNLPRLFCQKFKCSV